MVAENCCAESKKASRTHRGACTGVAGERRGLLSGSGGWRAAGLANLEAHKTPYRDVFAEVGNQLVNELPDGQRLVLNEVLLVQTCFLVKLLHLSGDDLLDHRSRLAGRAGLLAVDLALAFEDLRGDFFAAHKARVERGDVHGDVVAQALELFRACHEVGLTVDFDNHADFPPGVDVVAHQTLGGFPLRLFLRCGLALLPQDVDGLFDVADGFDQRGAAVAEAGAGALAQLFHQLCRDVDLIGFCAHRFSRFLRYGFEPGRIGPLFSRGRRGSQDRLLLGPPFSPAGSELCAALAALLPQNCDPRACWAVPRSTADYEKGPAPFAPIPSGWCRALCFVVTRSTRLCTNLKVLGRK